MTYDQTRDSETLRYLADATQDFIDRYTANATPQADRQTVILLVGGMAAQLLRAKTPYQDSGPPVQQFDYDVAWIDLDTILGGVFDLAMYQSGTEFRDTEDRVIIADGSVGFAGCTAYSGFTDWCGANNLDWFVFGWDWRRPVDDIANFFVGQFLPQFQSQVQNALGVDPLTKFSIIGHSFGGMVVNLVNRSTDPILDGLYRAITAAAPFYGYSGQIHRWFEGESYFNVLGKMTVIQTLTTFPGVYVLPFLDIPTYNTYQAQFQSDPLCPLMAYPCTDATTPGLLVDPFNPPMSGPERRYPLDTGFEFSELGFELSVLHDLVAPMPAGPMQDRFYCLRGIQPTNQTVGSITWQEIPPTYDPATSATPITDDPVMFPGDDTQPGWTARLVDHPSAQIISVCDDIDHAFLMEYASVQEAIGTILGLPLVAMLVRREMRPEATSSEDALAVVRTLQNLRDRDPDDALRPSERPAIQAVLRGLDRKQQRAIARRIIKDLIRHRPSPAEQVPEPQHR